MFNVSDARNDCFWPELGPIAITIVVVKEIGWIVKITPKNGRLWERPAFSHRRSRATRETQALEPTSRKWESWSATAIGPAENGTGAG